MRLRVRGAVGVCSEVSCGRLLLMVCGLAPRSTGSPGGLVGPQRSAPPVRCEPKIPGLLGIRRERLASTAATPSPRASWLSGHLEQGQGSQRGSVKCEGGIRSAVAPRRAVEPEAAKLRMQGPRRRRRRPNPGRQVSSFTGKVKPRRGAQASQPHFRDVPLPGAERASTSLHSVSTSRSNVHAT